MPPTKTFWWTPAPFLRLLPALVLGIVLGWYVPVLQPLWLYLGVGLLLALVLYSYLPVAAQFRCRWIAGFSLLGMLVCLGGALVRLHDTRNNKGWFGNRYGGNEPLVAVLEEMPVTKPHSLKAIASIQYLLADSLVPVRGKAILYFRKDQGAAGLHYGSRILIRKSLQPIRNSGNPGAFDYKRYCLFGGITHQVFLGAPDFRLLAGEGGHAFTRTIIRSRQAIVAILRRYIGGAQQQGLAEALLIGYKDDLDKGLVQAYSNTGVVHVIAISGLHLGLVYGLLVLLLKPLRKRSRLLHFLLIMAGLWSFALLAGAQPSVLRSAVMFSCMALGELMARRASVLNTLALSAFGLLCWNPFWLWDLGFQLSYAAVTSIVLFYQPLYRSIYFPNRLVNWVWQLVALTLTAQVFTLPISLYHFHQFPMLFLLTNLVAVPLSSVILIGEIALCMVAWLPQVAGLLGSILGWLIGLLNAYVLRFDALPVAVWDGFSLTQVQLVLLYVLLGSAGCCVLQRSRAALPVALSALVLFAVIQAQHMIMAGRQQQLVVYAVPRHAAADFVVGRKVLFRGSPALLQDGFERSFHLQPARTLFRAREVVPISGELVRAGNRFVLFYSRPARLLRLPDVLVVSGKVKPPKDSGAMQHKVQVVLDATVPLYRRRQWQELCRINKWLFHDVQEQGAFVMKW